MDDKQAKAAADALAMPGRQKHGELAERQRDSQRKYRWLWLSLIIMAVVGLIRYLQLG